MLQVSQNCFPSCCCDPVWNEDLIDMKNPIARFLDNPSRQTLDDANKELRAKTALDLIQISIQNDYYKVIKVILNQLDEPITNDIIEFTIRKGSPQMER